MTGTILCKRIPGRVQPGDCLFNWVRMMTVNAMPWETIEALWEAEPIEPHTLPGRQPKISPLASLNSPERPHPSADLCR